MKNYKMDFATRTLTISKDFAAMALNHPNSEEYIIMEQCRSLCPDLRIAYRTRKPSRSANAYKGMTYKKMEDYIKLYENANEILSAFRLVKAASKIQRNKYKFVYDWFLKQFPNYEEMPEIRNGKLYAEVVKIPEVEENQEENALEVAA